MTIETVGNRRRNRVPALTFGQTLLVVLGLYTWTVAAHLYKVLGSEQDFWVARGTTNAELLWTVLLLILAVPVVVGAVAGVFVRLPWRPARIPGYGVVALLCALAGAEAFQILGWDVPVVWTLVVGIGLTVPIVRYSTPRFLVSFMAPGLLVLTALFLLQPGARLILKGDRTQAAQGTAVGNPVPIVGVVFDGLPLYMLMDPDGSIDEHRFPNFQRLAATSTWFRDATTVADSTVQSVTSILTGQYPDQKYERAAVHQDYPLNLLTILLDEYQQNIFEQHTLLSRDGSEDQRALPALIQENLEDLTLIYLHGVLPTSLSTRLPAVDQTWRGFWRSGPSTVPPPLPREAPSAKRKWRTMASFRRWVREQTGEGNPDRAKRFSRFLDRLSSTQDLGLHYFKGRLPHRPWQYLPSGRSYKGFKEDQKAAGSHHAYQRHFLQTMYVDALLGRLLDVIEASDWGDQALVVITADHGVSFRKGRQSRRAHRETFAEILSVPLFVRLPGQEEGRIVDGPVETVDILPTILSVIQLEIEAEFDGEDAFARGGDRSVHHFVEDKLPVRRMIKVPHRQFLRQRRQALLRKVELFGSGADAWGLYRTGPHGEIVGRQLSELETAGTCESRAVLDQAPELDNLDLATGVVPALLRGRIDPQHPKTQLAVAVNGTIAAATITFEDTDGNQAFSTMIPEFLLRPGRNDVLLLEINPGEDLKLGACEGAGG